jgi:hypothetical protein
LESRSAKPLFGERACSLAALAFSALLGFGWLSDEQREGRRVSSSGGIFFDETSDR